MNNKITIRCFRKTYKIVRTLPEKIGNTVMHINIKWREHIAFRSLSSRRFPLMISISAVIIKKIYVKHVHSRDKVKVDQ